MFSEDTDHGEVIHHYEFIIILTSSHFQLPFSYDFFGFGAFDCLLNLCHALGE